VEIHISVSVALVLQFSSLLYMDYSEILWVII